MGLPEKLSALKASAENQLHLLDTKEKTKNALLLPFFEVLGYDSFDILEVEPGHAVELEEEGKRKIDYAVKIDGSPAMLFQCEEATADLEAFDGDPLFRYFGELETSIVVLTNGLSYRFYADIGEEVGVDERPFLEFDLLDYEPEQITRLKSLTKPAFDTQEVLSDAFELRYTRLLQNYFVQQQAPDEHFVRFLAAQVYEGDVSEGVIKRFRPIVRKILRQFATAEDEIQRQSTSRADDPNRPREDGEAGAMGQQEELPAEGKETGEQEEDATPKGGDRQESRNIAEEFANNVIGNS